MSTIVVNVARRPDLTHAEFVDYWRNRHAPLIRSCSDFCEHLVSYTQHDAAIEAPELTSLFGGAGDFDGIAVLRFKSTQALRQAFASRDYLDRVRPDEPNFVDLDRCKSYVADAFDVVGGPAPLFDIAGKVAVVTGGAKGVGAMLASALHHAGARVLVVGRDARAGEAFAADLGPGAEFVEADLADGDGVRQAARRIGERTEEVHILVNNAGSFSAAPIEATLEDEWDAVMGLNLRAPFFLTKALLPQLKAATRPGDPARVVMVGSIGALWGRSSNGAYGYGASKAAIHQLTRMLASDFTAQGINVNAIAPGFFPSDMTDGFFSAVPGLKEQIVAGIPAGRLGTSEDAAGALLFLASRAGAYVSGTILPVEGGLWQA